MKNGGSPDAAAVEEYFRALQDRLCDALESLDGGKKFTEQKWRHRAGAGGGRARLLSGGTVLEKAGVNFSAISGDSLPTAASARRPELQGRAFRALGVSLVVHPRNPFVPAAHLNVRFFVAREKPGDEKTTAWWFGGGFDLTPVYGFAEDARHWHRTARAACKDFGGDCHARCKAECDRYFYLRHRDEMRGVGGIFFDDWNRGGFTDSFAFCRSVGDHFLPAYLPIARRRMDTPWGGRERAFQSHRRGRYAEFNLVYDRGTLFGLQSGGRAEFILMSLPPRAEWRGDFRPQADSAEENLARDFLQPRDWAE